MIKGTVVAATTSIGTLINGNLGATVLNVVLLNIDSGTAYVGGSDVGTITTGMMLLPNATLSLTLAPHDVLYGIAPTGTVQISAVMRGLPTQ